jgi:GAF domain-containing protein
MVDRRDGSGWDVTTAAGQVFRVLQSMTVITGSDGAALMLADAAGRLRAVGGSTAEGLELEYVQEFERFGPAHECVATGWPTVVSDLPHDDRYQRIATQVAPVRSVLSIPVRIDGMIAGALNFYRFIPYAWTADEVAAGRQMADALEELLTRLASRTRSWRKGA